MNLLSTAIPWYARWLALAALCAAFGGWCYVHGMEHTQAAWDAEKAKQQAAALKREQANRAKELQLHQQLIEAQNDAKIRDAKYRADLDSARTESDGLRGDLADQRRQLPGLTEAAVRRYADAASVVFDDCQRKYQDLAGQADRIDSDRQTLMAGWPK